MAAKSKAKKVEPLAAGELGIGPGEMDAIEYCANCRGCIVSTELPGVCPSLERFNFYAYSMPGRFRLLKHLLSGDAKLGPDVADVFYSCTTCDTCSELCRNPDFKDEFTYNGMLEGFRAELVRRGLGPMPVQRRNLDYLRETHNPYGLEQSKRFDFLEGMDIEPAKRADVLFYVGCTSSFLQQQMARATALILQELEGSFSVMDDERCCGSYAVRVGDPELARELAEHNIARINEKKPEIVVFTCPGCLRAFKKDYPAMGMEPGFETLHISEYLKRKLEEGSAEIRGNIEAVATYHDPCHMGRHLDIYEPPREVLCQVPGLQLREMERNRKAALCCGAGGGVKSAYPDWAMQTAEKRLLEARMTGAQFLVTSCPFCLRNLQDALAATAWVSDTDLYLRVVDFAEMLEPVLRKTNK